MVILLWAGTPGQNQNVIRTEFMCMICKTGQKEPIVTYEIWKKMNLDKFEEQLNVFDVTW